MRRLILFFFCSFFYSNILYANNFAYVDINYIINNSIIGKNIMNKLKKINQDNLSFLKNEQQILNNEKSEIDNIKNLLSEDELKKKILNYNNKINDFNKKNDELTDKFNKLKQDEIDQLFNKLNPLIEKYMVTNKIDIILKKENVIFSNSQFDISDKLIDVINKNYKQ